jgi:hypothetical protein
VAGLLAPLRGEPEPDRGCPIRVPIAFRLAAQSRPDSGVNPGLFKANFFRCSARLLRRRASKPSAVSFWICSNYRLSLQEFVTTDRTRRRGQPNLMLVAEYYSRPAVSKFGSGRRIEHLAVRTSALFATRPGTVAVRNILSNLSTQKSKLSKHLPCVICS